MQKANRYLDITDLDYPGLREVLAPQYRNLPTEDIEELFENYNLSAEDLEGFFYTMKKIGKKVVSVAPTILPIAGTAIGALGAQLALHLRNFGQSCRWRDRTNNWSSAHELPQLHRTVNSVTAPGASSASLTCRPLIRPTFSRKWIMVIAAWKSNVKVGSTPVRLAFTHASMYMLMAQANS